MSFTVEPGGVLQLWRPPWMGLFSTFPAAKKYFNNELILLLALLVSAVQILRKGLRPQIPPWIPRLPCSVPVWADCLSPQDLPLRSPRLLFGFWKPCLLPVWVISKKGAMGGDFSHFHITKTDATLLQWLWLSLVVPVCIPCFIQGCRLVRVLIPSFLPHWLARFFCK